jgi:methyltransferase family protein
MRADYAQVFQDTRAVDKYENVVYAPDSYSSAVDARQRRYLRRLVVRAFVDRRPVQHDFACGTGRGVKLLRGLVREAHGYDPSPAMLDRARSCGVRAQWHEIPASGPVPAPSTVDGPAVVTVFRLLLNATDEVRDRALRFAALALPDAGAGLLVLQNHGNATSLRHLRHRRHARDPWYAELSHEQVAELLGRHGFALVQWHGCAVLPKGAYRPRLLRPLVRRLDDLLCRLGWLTRYATDVLYVARRTTASIPTPEVR